MTTEQIEKFIEQPKHAGNVITIHFKDRQTVSGVFVEDADYGELKSKNLWRIVREANIAEWKQSKNQHLNRIFNGSTFTRLSEN